MDESLTLMLHVRAGKIKRREETKSGGGRFKKQERCCGRDRMQREDAGKPCWISSFRGETAELRDAPDKQERAERK